MDIVATLVTGFGFWNPIIWLAVLAVALVIAYLIWLTGESSYKPGTEQTKPYLSGNPEPAKQDVHVGGGHLYWGFTEAMRGYYDRIVPLHTGVLTDYLLWFFGIAAILILIVGLI
ncbi:hydrogenase [Methanoculleus frigidifontis]|uniref:hydrogenase n=1 Tax=Methanoculleus frigidifontis TaxID=2584085 RepID=UPI002658E04E|nr:hydrogenase [Methanoculleus sp. FWC-SCC1]